MGSFVALILLTTGLWTPAKASEAPKAPTVLSFEDASKLALGANPDLFALRYQEESQRYQARQALAPNNPTLILNKNDIPGVSLTSTGASTVYGLTFTLGFPGKALTLSAANRYQADSIREQSAAKEIDILIALSNNFVALASTEKLFAFLTGEERKAADLIKLLERKYSAGQAAQADLLNQRVVVAGLQHDILDNRNSHELLLTQFRNLIKKPGATEYSPRIPDQIVVPKLSKSLDDLTEIMLHNRHQLKSAHKQVEATEASLTNVSLSPFPDFQMSASMNVYNVPSAAPVTGISRDYSVGIGLVIPIFFPFNELSGIQAARRNLDAAEALEDSQRLQSMSDLQTAYTSFQSAQRAIESSQNLVIPAAKASYDLTLTAFSLGKADYFILNESRKNWIQAETDLLSRQVGQAQFFNQIVQQVGCDVTSGGGPDACK